jgi:hypothetical protein
MCGFGAKVDWCMKKNGHTSKSDKVPAFVSRAERALRRAAENVGAQNRAMKLPLIVWENGKVVRKPA